MIFLTFLLLPSFVYATPVLYTFEGEIDSISDGAGAVSAAGLNVGDNITHTVLVDYELEGYSITNDGIVNYIPDDTSYDSYYVEFVSGTFLYEVDAGYYDKPDDQADQHMGLDFYLSNHSSLIMGSMDAFLLIRNSNYAGFLKDMSIGSEFSGNMTVVNMNMDTTQVISTLTLTDISSSPVPEPATIILLGTGLLGLAGASRKTFQKK